VGSRVQVDADINSELEYIMKNLELATGRPFSKPKTVRFLINHYNASKKIIKTKKKPRSKNGWIFS